MKKNEASCGRVSSNAGYLTSIKEQKKNESIPLWENREYLPVYFSWTERYEYSLAQRQVSYFILNVESKSLNQPIKENTQRTKLSLKIL